jgi:hypothetical protein
MQALLRVCAEECACASALVSQRARAGPEQRTAGQPVCDEEEAATCRRHSAKDCPLPASIVSSGVHTGLPSGTRWRGALTKGTCRQMHRCSIPHAVPLRPAARPRSRRWLHRTASAPPAAPWWTKHSEVFTDVRDASSLETLLTARKDRLVVLEWLSPTCKVCSSSQSMLWALRLPLSRATSCPPHSTARQPKR